MTSRGTAGDRERLTITLGLGQRETLEAVAQRNNTTLAYVVRFALDQFIEEHGQGRLPLRFPDGR